MSTPRTLFPVSAGALEASPGTPAVLLDGMEVLFDRTVGLYPVEIEPTPAEAPPATAARGATAAPRIAHANGVRH